MPDPVAAAFGETPTPARKALIRVAGPLDVAPCSLIPGDALEAAPNLAGAARRELVARERGSRCHVSRQQEQVNGLATSA